MANVSDIFIDSNEKEVVTIGREYLEEFLETGELDGGFCVVSDRRAYCNGKYYNKMGKIYTPARGEKIIDLKDVTGSEHSMRKRRIPVMANLRALCCYLLWMMALVLIFNNYNDVTYIHLLMGLSVLAFPYILEMLLKEKELAVFKEYVKKISDVGLKTGVILVIISILLLICCDGGSWQMDYFLYSLMPLIVISTSACFGVRKACLLWHRYLSKKMRLYEIIFAGGAIVFEISDYSESEIHEFQRALRSAKDNISSVQSNNSFSAETAAPVQDRVETATITSPVQNNGFTTVTSVADELKKYKELLDAGVISQEEFDTLKTKALK